MEEEVTYMQKFMKVQTSDNETFEVSSQLCNFCKHFQQVLQDAAISEIIQIEISSQIFKRIIDYFEHYKFKPIKLNLPKPLPQGDLSKFLNEYDYKFIYELSDNELYNLIEVKYYLYILKPRQQIIQIVKNYSHWDVHVWLQFLKVIEDNFDFYQDGTFDEVKTKFGIEAELNQELKEQFYLDYDDLF